MMMTSSNDPNLWLEVAYTEYVTEHRGYKVYEKGWSDGDIEYEFVPDTGAKNVLPNPYLSDGIYDEPLDEEALHGKIDDYLEEGSY